MDDLIYLHFRNFPRDFTNKDIQEFLSHFGAVHITYGRKVLRPKEKGHAIASFRNIQIAEALINKLHQIRLIDSRLCVKFFDNPETKNAKVKKLKRKRKKVNSNIDVPHLFELYKKLKAIFDTQNSYEICQFPPINYSILKNIENILLNNQIFYNEVCNLLRKLNLPCPFIPIEFPNASSLDIPITSTSCANEEDSEIEDNLSSNLPKPPEMFEFTRAKIIKDRITNCKPLLSPKIQKHSHELLKSHNHRSYSISKYMPPPPPSKLCGNLHSVMPDKMSRAENKIFDETNIIKPKSIKITKILESEIGKNSDITSTEISSREMPIDENISFKFNFSLNSINNSSN